MLSLKKFFSATIFLFVSLCILNAQDLKKILIVEKILFKDRPLIASYADAFKFYKGSWQGGASVQIGESPSLQKLSIKQEFLPSKKDDVLDGTAKIYSNDRLFIEKTAKMTLLPDRLRLETFGKNGKQDSAYDGFFSGMNIVWVPACKFMLFSKITDEFIFNSGKVYLSSVDQTYVIMPQRNFQGFIVTRSLFEKIEEAAEPVPQEKKSKPAPSLDKNYFKKQR